jgi:DNA repair protein radA
LEEVNRLLGGGIVPGSMLLLGGEPGIGKSTLSLQIALSATLDRVLYVSGEESANQVKIRADRLSASADRCLVLNETLLENILTQCQAVSPSLLVVDSIQTLYSEAVESSAGSVSQVRECAAGLLRYAKTSGVPVFLIGHINKEGTIAGPKVLEHIVDVVLQFEGDSTHMYRVLRSVKNRFGSTSELAMFEMQGDGLRQITNPSELLLGERDSGLSGVAVAAAVDGARPMLVEVQALVSSAAYGTPQRSTTGFDVRRLNMLLAVLEKRAGFKLASKDVFLNIAGGVRIVDPGIDLAVVAAVLSSNFDVALPPDTAFAAEVGLSGEVRGVARLEQRIAEGQRLGFTHTMAAARAREGSIPQRLKVHYYPIARVEELAKWVLGR